MIQLSIIGIFVIVVVVSIVIATLFTIRYIRSKIDEESKDRERINNIKKEIKNDMNLQFLFAHIQALEKDYIVSEYVNLDKTISVSVVSKDDKKGSKSPDINPSLLSELSTKVGNLEKEVKRIDSSLEALLSELSEEDVKVKEEAKQKSEEEIRKEVAKEIVDAIIETLNNYIDDEIKNESIKDDSNDSDDSDNEKTIDDTIENEDVTQTENEDVNQENTNDKEEEDVVDYSIPPEKKPSNIDIWRQNVDKIKKKGAEAKDAKH